MYDAKSTDELESFIILDLRPESEWIEKHVPNSVPFSPDLHVNDALFGDLITVFSKFSDQMFSIPLDRVKFHDYTLILKTIDSFILYYIFIGPTHKAQQKLNHFYDILSIVVSSDS